MIRPAAAALVCLLASCGQDRIAGGSTSETSNGLTVRILDEKGAFAAHVRVRIRPAEFLASSSPATDDPQHVVVDTATDDSGWIRLGLPASAIQVEAFASRMAAQAHAESGGTPFEVRLSPTTRITGMVALGNGEGPARIQVRGMEHSVWTNADGAFQLDSLPAGNLRLRAWIPGIGKSVEQTVATVSATATDIGVLVPAYAPTISTDSVRVVLNTKTGGGVIAARVDTVPILVRLDGADFPVSARNNGADLRVVDSTGNPIPFSWSLWSPATREAHLWVRVTSVRPGDSTQGFRIRWGDPSAADESRPWTVFSAATGWSGAWDLNRSYLDRAARRRVADASSWTDDGLLTGNPTTDPVDGLHFLRQGKDGLAMAGTGTNLTGNFTVLIRARAENSGAILLGKGDSVWNHGMKEFYLGVAGSTKILRRPGWYPSFMAWADTGYNVYSVSNKAVDSSAWTLFVARHALGAGDSGTVEWFVNGTKTATIGTQALQYENDHAGDSLVVGWRHRAIDRFSGSLAEIWILSRTVSDDWIRLQSECRKDGGGTLVRLRH